ncbi:MAG: CapA family protein [Jatrophihabitans sp.]|uniref:CapA family protein n=1 Tax=Jatrophihabitans sp. TaxID=1932789 RepID=UPI00390F80CC
MIARDRLRISLVVSAAALLIAGCTSGGTHVPPPRGPESTAGTSPASHPRTASARPPTATAPSGPHRAGEFTISFAGDVHFAGRVAKRLVDDPATAFGEAAPGLAKADLTVVNLETAITTGGQAQNKAFTFRAPPTAFTALRDAGVDVATMANNHGADFGADGLRDSLAAIRSSHFPVIGIGQDAAHAFAPYTTTLNGVRVALIGADQVQDETTLRLFSAGPHQPGVANAFSPQLTEAVRKAKAAGYVVIVYVHWGIEYKTCPSGLQTTLAGALARAGADAVIGTHAHVLQGAGWRPDGTYVAYGLGNYLWWMSFGNNQDDNGVLTLTFRHASVVSDAFAPSHLDSRGVPLPATGAEKERIAAEWKAARKCTDLAVTAPR